MIRIITFVVALLAASAANAQSGKLQAYNIWGNPTASAAYATSTTISAILDAQLTCSGRGSLIMRGASAWTCFSPGTSGKPLVSAGTGADLTYATLGISGGGTNCAAASGTCLDNITSFSSTGYMNRTGAGTYTFNTAATNAQYLAGTATVPIQPNVIYQAEVDLGNSGSGTLAFDFSLFINARVTMTGNIGTNTLSNVTAGKAGTIAFIQNGSGSNTMTFSTTFKFAGGSIPALSTAANAVDILNYSCRSATFCVASLMKDVKNP